jgi:glycosyltransferase involved in cell wall biosynthesis
LASCVDSHVRESGHDLARERPRTHNSRRRVLHVVRSLEVGGLERLVANMVQARGFDITQVACLLTAGAFAEPLRNAGANVRSYSGRDARTARFAWLKRIVCELRPEIIHCHGIYSFLFGGLVAKWCRTERIGLVLTKHGQAIPETPLVRYLAPWLMKRACVVCVSPDIEGIVQARFTQSLGATCYIPNGIDLSAFAARKEKQDARAAVGLPADAFIVGSVGRLSSEKGFDVLLDAVANLAAEQLRFMLVIVGEGPQKPGLVKKIQQSGLSEHVLLLGERHDIPNLLASFDGFVLASRSEGQPLSVIEAMASGLPVIATAVGGIPSIIEDGVTGMLVPPEDSAAIGHALRELALRPDDFRPLGVQAAHVARCRFGMSPMLDAYEHAYETALEMASRRGLR